MSSDQRLKKLRGSGGHVMARVDDDLQRKGNLGGPDLFLAPVGRLPEQLISSYFCNACEKEYEGGPRIDYETPNESVSDNLILIERGQYVCTTCEAPIAEYREFKKADEAADVGLARTAEQIAAGAQQAAQPEAAFAPPAEEAGAGAPPQEAAGVSSIAGMDVYDENAVRIGTAKQVGIDASKSLVLTIQADDGTESSVAWDRVGKVGEIIVLGSGGEGSPPAAPAGACASCGFANKSGSRFCEQCGAKI